MKNKIPPYRLRVGVGIRLVVLAAAGAIYSIGGAFAADHGYSGVESLGVGAPGTYIAADLPRPNDPEAGVADVAIIPEGTFVVVPPKRPSMPPFDPSRFTRGVGGAQRHVASTRYPSGGRNLKVVQLRHRTFASA